MPIRTALIASIAARVFAPARRPVAEPLRSGPVLMGGGCWVLEHYSGLLAGGIHFDEVKGRWAYVLFQRKREQDQFAAVEHDLGFTERSDAVDQMRRSAARFLR